MGPEFIRERIQAARRLKPVIDQRYPPGRWVAVEDGRVVTDAASLETLNHQIASLGSDPGRFLVMQAGVIPPESVYIEGLGLVGPQCR